MQSLPTVIAVECHRRNRKRKIHNVDEKVCWMEYCQSMLGEEALAPTSKRLLPRKSAAAHDGLHPLALLCALIGSLTRECCCRCVLVFVCACLAWVLSILIGWALVFFLHEWTGEQMNRL
mmetsp:Transcript_67123/g.106265  ORF Transcript_67123/g.106265 Transcript_67123/m.106265 type:complete len:120 (+) Transcript_67123:730-1089(+)